MKDHVETPGTCPFRGTRIGGAIGDGPTLEDWWPGRLPVELLHVGGKDPDPADPDFDYAAAFEALELAAVKADIFAMLRSSQPWWPSDYGHYGPQMIRMAWHSAGTYRIADGRGGAGGGLQRFAPVASWIDNGNIDKSRRLLWPIKKKYGASLSWADLIILTGNCALEDMGFPVKGFAGGREDAWEADRVTYWGPEAEMEGRTRWAGSHDQDYFDLENPLGASVQSLIYVQPEGPGGVPDAVGSAREIRETFARMAMNDVETVALIAGGHAFGKSHGAVSPENVGVAPDGAPIEQQGFGWHNSAGTGNAEYTFTNGIEGSWTSKPTRWDDEYLRNLFENEWEVHEGPGGAKQWRPVRGKEVGETPDAHREGVSHSYMMMTSDIALKEDPSYAAICRDFMADFDYFTDEFSKAWYKLTHRDMGPKDRYLGAEVPRDDYLWQDPVPPVDHPLVDEADIADLKRAILDGGLGVSALASAAWASASTFRVTDKRGGANGARIRLAPQKDWEVNRPEDLARVLAALERVKADFDGKGDRKVSLADLIVLGGCAAVETAASDAGFKVTVPFTPGRTDATEAQTDAESFEWLRPVADGFRNYHEGPFDNVSPERFLLDRASLLGLTGAELTVLVGGMRALGTNWDRSDLGMFTDRPGVLTNDFFARLYDMDIVWTPDDETALVFTGRSRADGTPRYRASRADLVFGHDAQLRNFGEFYAADDAGAKFVRDFVAAWDKVMMADRYDVSRERRAA